MTKRNYYMHTINGCPATFHDGQICYASIRGNYLVASLKQIRAEQKATEEYRSKRGFNVYNKYDYVLVTLPKE
jgi:hypothetical protein